jgi:hypothetical protein
MSLVQDRPDYQILLGSDQAEEIQVGVLGRVSVAKREPRVVAMNLLAPQCISIVGQPGGGKSYTLGVLQESSTTYCKGLTQVPAPRCVVQIHYSDNEAHHPEFLTSVNPNSNPKELQILQRDYPGIVPVGMTDILMLAAPDMVERRRRQYPGVRIEPLAVNLAELSGSQWKYLMGCVGDQSVPVRITKNIIRDLDMRSTSEMNLLTLANIADAIENSDEGKLLNVAERKMAKIRLAIAKRFIDETGPGIGSYVKPGRLIIVDARDDFMEKQEVFSLLLVLLQIFAGATDNGKPINKTVVFDEAHQYMSDDFRDLVDGLISLIRVMRHKSTTICVASQDPLSIPQRVLELSTQFIIHKMISPKWLRWLQDVNTSLADIRPADVADLGHGEAYFWTQKCSEVHFTKKAEKILIRPRFSHHGGFTKVATS